MIKSKIIRDSVKNACDALTNVQDRLFDIAKDSAKLDEPTAWHDAEVVIQLAKEAAAFRKRLEELLTHEESTEVPVANNSSIPSRPERIIKPSDEQTIQKKKKMDYPKYQIADDCLVKTGLQRDRRTEYQHIVPRAAFDKVVSTVSKQLSKSNDFSPESLLAELNIPSYQTYVVLSMLRQMGLLKNPRRGHYGAVDSRNFATSASMLWKTIEAEG